MEARPIFPKELAAVSQWICWRLEPDKNGGKDLKTPYNAVTGSKASSTNPQSWTTLDNALSAKKQYRYNGIGFVFVKNGGLVGVDIDHCRDKASGELSETAKAILAKLPTYTEISQSGTGLHLIFKGAMPAKGNRNSTTGVEMYSHSRYFTMTGRKLSGSPAAIATDDGTLLWIHQNYVRPQKKPKKRRGHKSIKLSDEEVLEKAKAAENGDAFTALWRGRWTELTREGDEGNQKQRYGSQSEADSALCAMLAFWTGKDKEQMDRLFRQSGLMRDKWDTVHHASGATYGQETIDQAVEITTEVFDPASDLGIFEHEGRYFRTRGESVYAITNFVLQPVEMILAENEAQMTADLVTVRGDTYRQTFMTTDFVSTQKFKGVLNKQAIALGFLGSDGDLELFKVYISEMGWPKKYGVKAAGIYEYAGRPVFVCEDGAVEAGGALVEDFVQLGKYHSISTAILRHDPISAKGLRDLGEWLLSYNEPAKAVSVLSWSAGCFIKPHLRKESIKFPHLMLIGEQGSGKSNTLERIIMPIFSRTKITAATQVTAFTLMKESASANCIPQPLDEFKPSKIDKIKLNALYNHFRDAYDGHEGVRGRADQTEVTYELLAPLVVAGEESADEAAIRERSVELLFSKKDLKPAACHAAFNHICVNAGLLGDFGRSLLDAALSSRSDEVLKWYKDGVPFFPQELPSRVVNNLACCYAGLCLVEKLCMRLGLKWDDVFPYRKDACGNYLTFAAREYLLDGSLTNKSVVEETLEVFARMGLDPKSEFKVSNNGQDLVLWLASIYDRYTGYRREYAVVGEVLPYSQFQKQLKHSDLFRECKACRIGDKPHKCWILNYPLLKERCDVDGFEVSDIQPL